jgi:hypothetical protein
MEEEEEDDDDDDEVSKDIQPSTSLSSSISLPNPPMTLHETTQRETLTKSINEDDLELNFRIETTKYSIQLIHLNISTENSCKKITYAKCDLCSYINYLDEYDSEDSINFASLKSHIANAHLILANKLDQDESVDDDLVIKHLLVSIVDKIEEELERVGSFNLTSTIKYKCTFCQNNNSFFANKIDLCKHLLASHSDGLNKVDCMHCSKEFGLENIKEFLNHLKSEHFDACVNLVNGIKAECTPDKRIASLNWEEYFSTKLTDYAVVDTINDFKPVSSAETIITDEIENKEDLMSNVNSSEKDEEKNSSSKSENSFKNNNEERSYPQEAKQQDQEIDSISKQEENSKSDESDKADVSISQKTKPKIKKPKSDANEERYN